MNNTPSEPIVVIHDGMAYTFADETSLEAWSLNDSPTYQQVRPATTEELAAGATDLTASSPG